MKNTKSNITRRITECRDVFKTTLEGRFRLFLCPVTLVMIYFFMCWNLAASETPQRPECYGLLMIDAIDSKAAFLAGSLKRGEFGKEEGDSIETIAKSNFASDLDMLSKWLDLENSNKILFGADMGDRMAEETKHVLKALIQNSKGVILFGAHRDLGVNHDFGEILRVFRNTLGELRSIFVRTNKAARDMERRRNDGTDDKDIESGSGKEERSPQKLDKK